MNNKTDGQLKVCIVGAGMIFQKYHLPAMLNNEFLKLHAVVDKNQDVLNNVSSNYLGSVYKNIQDVKDCDLCLVATPPHVRENVVIPALAQGMHVVCEKPISFSTEEAERMIKASIKYRKRLYVAHTRRFFPNIQAIRSFLKNRLFGENIEIVIVEGGAYGWESIANDRARIDPTDYGVIHDEGAHVFDIISQFLTDLNIPVGSLECDAAIVDRKISPNNCKTLFKWNTDHSEGNILIKLSRNFNLQRRIFIRNHNFTVSTRSLFSNELTIAFSDGRVLTIQDCSKSVKNLEQVFEDQWNSILADIIGTNKDDTRASILAESILPTYYIIDKVISSAEAIKFDSYFGEDNSAW